MSNSISQRIRNYLTIRCDTADFTASSNMLLVLRQNGHEFDYEMQPDTETTALVYIPKADAMRFDDNDIEAQIFLTDADGIYRHSRPKTICVATVLAEAGYGT